MGSLHHPVVLAQAIPAGNLSKPIYSFSESLVLVTSLA